MELVESLVDQLNNMTALTSVNFYIDYTVKPRFISQLAQKLSHRMNHVRVVLDRLSEDFEPPLNELASLLLPQTTYFKVYDTVESMECVAKL